MQSHSSLSLELSRHSTFRVKYIHLDGRNLIFSYPTDKNKSTLYSNHFFYTGNMHIHAPGSNLFWFLFPDAYFLTHTDFYFPHTHTTSLISPHCQSSISNFIKYDQTVLLVKGYITPESNLFRNQRTIEYPNPVLRNIHTH